jgi:hypothetical protein
MGTAERWRTFDVTGNVPLSYGLPIPNDYNLPSVFACWWHPLYKAGQTLLFEELILITLANLYNLSVAPRGIPLYVSIDSE